MANAAGELKVLAKVADADGKVEIVDALADFARMSDEEVGFTTDSDRISSLSLPNTSDLA